MKLNLFARSNHNHNFNLLKVTVNKEMNHSTSNSGLWILAIVAVSVLGTAGITLGLFSSLFDKKKKSKDKKDKSDKY